MGFALALSASAAEYPVMSFETADGSVQSVSSDNLTMSFSAESLFADHSGGRLEIPVSNLRKFYFVADPSSVVAPGAETDGSVEVFSATGIGMGRYASEADAKSSLPAGLYVMKSASRTFKTIVK